MAADRFSRFQNLERERERPLDGGADENAESARFDALEMDAVPQPGPAPVAQGHLSRFDAPQAPAVSLDASTEQDQPFIRCRVCEGDNNRYAVECQHCSADLNTQEQRTFNEQLWTRLRETRRQEAEAHQQALAAQLQAELDLKKEQRAFYEHMARQVARRTEAELEGRPPPIDLFDPEVGTRRVERAVMVVAIAFFVGLFALFLSQGHSDVTRRLVWVLVLAIIPIAAKLARSFGIR